MKNLKALIIIMTVAMLAVACSKKDKVAKFTVELTELSVVADQLTFQVVVIDSSALGL